MSTPASNRLALARLGAWAGLATCLVYPAIISGALPDAALVPFVAAMGPLLGIASLGLREMLRFDRPTIAADLGAVFNLLAGALLTAMLFVQLSAPDDRARELEPVWAGLDLAWDVYLALGTFAFALAAWRHVRFGRIVGASGATIAIALLALNLLTAPTPPAYAGLIDLGPAVGLWYFVVTLIALRSLGWARTREVGDPADRSAVPPSGRGVAAG